MTNSSVTKHSTLYPLARHTEPMKMFPKSCRMISINLPSTLKNSGVGPHGAHLHWVSRSLARTLRTLFIVWFPLNLIWKLFMLFQLARTWLKHSGTTVSDAHTHTHTETAVCSSALCRERRSSSIKAAKWSMKIPHSAGLWDTVQTDSSKKKVIFYK